MNYNWITILFYLFGGFIGCAVGKGFFPSKEIIIIVILMSLFLYLFKITPVEEKV